MDEPQIRILEYLEKQSHDFVPTIGSLAATLGLPLNLAADDVTILSDQGFVHLKALPTLPREAARVLLAPSGLAQLAKRRKAARNCNVVVSATDDLSGANVDRGSFDAFISFASEDKADFVDPLVAGLQLNAVRVWYAPIDLKVGDRQRNEIDGGLLTSRYGIVVASHHYFRKSWPQNELNALVALETSITTKILPVWYDISREDVLRYSPVLADRVAAKSSDGLPKVVSDLMRVIRPESNEALRARALRLSNDLLTLWRTYHDSAPGPLVGAAEYARQSLKLSSDTMGQYAILYAAQVISMHDTLASRGLTDPVLDALFNHPTNPLGIREVGQRLGAIAERIL